MVNMAGPSTKPADCVLAFAIPTTREVFVRDLGLGPMKDFAGHVVAHQAASSDAERRELFDGCVMPA